MRERTLGDKSLVKNKMLESQALESKGSISDAIDLLERVVPKCGLTFPELHFRLGELYIIDQIGRAHV